MRTKTLAYSAVAVLCASFAAADVVQQAEVLAARKDWASAMAAYEEAIRQNPQDASLRNRVGICYQNAGDTKKAKKAYQSAIALRKDYAEAWNNLGTLEHSKNHYGQAIAAYTRATALKPHSAVSYRNLGAAWAAKGDLDKAFAAWSEAYRIDPNFHEDQSVDVAAGGLSAVRQYYLFAKLFAGRGQTDDAFAYLEKAHALGFTNFAQVEGDQDFASLVKDPRYAALK